MKFPRFQIVQILKKEANESFRPIQPVKKTDKGKKNDSKEGFEHIPFPMILSTSTTFTDLENIILKFPNIFKHPTMTSTIYNEQRGIP